MKTVATILVLFVSLFGLQGLLALVEIEESANELVLPPKEVPYLKVVQLIQGDPMQRQYADALPSLLAEIRERTTLNVDPFPIYIESLEDEVIFKHPVIYINFADRQEWSLSPGEVKNLKSFIERGGFMSVSYTHLRAHETDS